MANGRLAKCTINPYSSGLAYHNTSGNQASITIGAQVLDENINTSISVSVEDTERIIGAATTLQTVCAPVNCISSIITNPDTSYQGFYSTGTACFYPTYTSCSSTVTCHPYRNNTFCHRTCDCIRFYCFESGAYYCCVITNDPPATISNTSLVINRNAYDNPHYLKDEKNYFDASTCIFNNFNTITFNCCGDVKFYNPSLLTTEEQTATNFVSPTCTAVPYCCCSIFLSAAVDYWSKEIGVFGIAVGGSQCCGATCSNYVYYECATTGIICGPGAICLPKDGANGIPNMFGSMTGCYCCTTGCYFLCSYSTAGYCPLWNNYSDCVPSGCCCICCTFTTRNEAIVGITSTMCCMVNRMYDRFTSNKGPFFLSGCNLQAVKSPRTDSLYYFSAHCCRTTMVQCWSSACCCQGVLHFYTPDNGTFDIYPGTTDTSIYPIKWLSYNPVVNCNYFMYFGSSKDLRGIYSVNWDKVRCTSCVSNTCEGYCNNTGFGYDSFSTFFNKVSELPTPLIECSPIDFCPTPIFRTGKSSWKFSVNDSGTWKEYCSCDMSNWYPRTSFYQQTSGGAFTTNGTEILKCCNCFDSVISYDTYIDYKVSVNNYERTGLVISNGDRVYVNNPSGQQLSVNVWGYEG